MDEIDSSSGTGDSEAPVTSSDVPELYTFPNLRASCPTCGAPSAPASIDQHPGGHEQITPQLQPSGRVNQLALHIRDAIHTCALEIIATETRCVEWGAPAQRSVELAEEAIINIVSLAVFSTKRVL